MTAGYFRSSHPEVFLGKGILKICRKFTGEHPWRSVISIKLLIEITLPHGCSLVNLLHVFRTTFPKNTSGRLLLLFHSLQLQEVPHTSPDHLIQPVTPDEDIVLSNPSLAENGQSSGRVELQWRNLCVDAELPPPSCFKRCREKNVGPRTKSILKNGILIYLFMCIYKFIDKEVFQKATSDLQ